jgi:hypothetical protein
LLLEHLDGDEMLRQRLAGRDLGESPLVVPFEGIPFPILFGALVRSRVSSVEPIIDPHGLSQQTPVRFVP